MFVMREFMNLLDSLALPLITMVLVDRLKEAQNVRASQEVGISGAAKTLKVTMDSIYRMIWSGRLEAKKNSRQVDGPACSH